MNDVQAFADAVAQAIDAATAPLLARIAVLEKRAVVHGRDGRDGLNGKDAPAPDVDAIVARVMAQIPTPRDGKDADVDLDVIAAKAAALVPPGPPGPSGKDAPPVDVDAIAVKAAALVPVPPAGRDGLNGKDASVDLDLIALKAAALIPKPADGRDAPPVDLDVVAMKAAALIPAPRDGKDAPAVDLDALAVKAAALIPTPRDGKDAYIDLDSLAVKAAALVPAPVLDRTVLRPDTKDVDERITRAITTALAAVPKAVDGKDGKDGQSVDPEWVRKCIAEEVARIPVPRDGKDGRDVDAAMLETIVSATVDRVLSGWERPADGKSLTPEDVAPLIQSEVTKAVAALPKAKDGRGVHAAFITHAGDLALTFSDGAQEKVGPVVGAPGKDADMEAIKKHAEDLVARIPLPKDGAPGKDGVDGLGIDDLDLIVDEQKGYVLRWANGSRVKEQPLLLPFDRGVYRPGVTYRKASLVTAQGSLWMALEDTSDRPGDSKAWRLAVKRGRDGKDAPRRDDV